MLIPEIKTLIKYRKSNGEGKNVICKFISEEDNYYDIENMILDSYPFETNCRTECNQYSEEDSIYEILELDKDFNEIGKTMVYFGYILTFSNKAFLLKEYKDDYVKFEHLDFYHR